MEELSAADLVGDRRNKPALDRRVAVALPQQSERLLERVLERSVLAADISGDVLKKLTDAYALIDRLNIDRAQPSSSGSLDDQRVTDLENERGSVNTARTNLDTALGKKHPERVSWSLRVLTGTVVLVAIIALILAAVIHRPHLNATTIGAAVSSALSATGPKMVADCRPNADDWRCVAYKLSPSCTTGRAAPDPPPPKRRRPVRSPASTVCAQQLVALNDGAALDVIRLPSQVEREELVARINKTDIGRNRWINKLKFFKFWKG
jgi:hypothetical protein